MSKINTKLKNIICIPNYDHLYLATALLYKVLHVNLITYIKAIQQMKG